MFIGINIGVNSLRQGGGYTIGLAANRGRLATNTFVPGGVITYRTEHWASPQGNIDQIRPMWIGMYYRNDNYLLGNTGSDTIEASIEYPAGTFTRLTFGGNNQVVLTGGNAVVADACPLVIPKGERFWVRTFLAASSGGLSPRCSYPAAPSVIGVTDGADTSGSSKLLTGTIAVSASGNVWGPSAIFGRVARAGARGFLLFGDSVQFGASDATSVGAKGGSGIFQRALDPKYPWASIAVGGATLQALVSLPTKITAIMDAMAPLGGPTDVVANYCINDLKAGRTVSQLKADYQTLLGLTGGRFWPVTVGPRTTSATSNWTVTPGDQVPRTDGQWSNHPTFNQDVRAGLPGMAGYIEGGDLYASSRDSGYWAAHSPAWTDDGTHHTSAGASAIAAAMVIP